MDVETSLGNEVEPGIGNIPRETEGTTQLDSEGFETKVGDPTCLANVTLTDSLLS